MATRKKSSGERRTQAERRAQSRSALLEVAARGLSRHGYARLNLEHVAREAGYTRGALYHQFANKEDLAAAVLEWIEETWTAEVGHLLSGEGDPVDAILAAARGHAAYCRRGIARAHVALRLEFPDSSHPVGASIAAATDRLDSWFAALIADAQRSGAVPDDPPALDVARAVTGAMEAVVIELAEREPYDAQLAERAVRGLLGLAPDGA